MGVTLYHMATGEHPFDVKNKQDLIADITKG